MYEGQWERNKMHGQGILIWHSAGRFHAANSEVHSQEHESGVLVDENSKVATFKNCQIYGNAHAGIAGLLHSRGLSFSFMGFIGKSTGDFNGEFCGAPDI